MSLLLIGNRVYANSDTVILHTLVQDSPAGGVYSDTALYYAVHVSSDLEMYWVHQPCSESRVEYSLMWHASKDVEISYSIIAVLWSDTEIRFDFALLSEVSIDYRISGLQSDTLIVYEFAVFLYADTDIAYELRRAECASDTGILYTIFLGYDTTLNYSIIGNYLSDTGVTYDLIGRVYSDTTLLYDLLAGSAVNNDLYVEYTLINDTAVFTNQSVIVSVNGADIHPIGINITHGESPVFCWSFSLTLQDDADWALCSVGEVIDIILNGDTYKALIDSRSRTMEWNGVSLTVEARSPSSVFGMGASGIHKTWGAISSTDLLNEICPGIQNNLATWWIPDKRCVSEGAAPITLAKTIVEANGGFLYTTVEGDLTADYVFNIPPPLLIVGDEDLYLDTEGDILSIQEARVLKEGYNSVDVTDTAVSDTSIYRMEVTALSIIDSIATVRITVYPFVNMIEPKTSHNAVTFFPQQVMSQSEIIEETVEVVDGVASVTAPISNIVSHSYQDFNLGLLEYSGTQITTNITGNSLLKIEYETKFHEMQVFSAEKELTQIFLEGL